MSGGSARTQKNRADRSNLSVLARGTTRSQVTVVSRAKSPSMRSDFNKYISTIVNKSLFIRYTFMLLFEIYQLNYSLDL